MDIAQLGGQLFDEYQLVELIGEGGMSAVYRAHQAELDRDVAIKILSPNFVQQPNYGERFIREAKMAASLEHPHIVPIYDYGTFNLPHTQEQMSFVVMRLLRGGSLWDYLQSGRKLSLNETTALIHDIAKALGYAHRRGIIHRDVKPSNIMFDENGMVYLVDFGIAKATQADMGLTADNIVLGTPPYISPEQWRGETISPAVDQYALAAIAYEIVTGRTAFDAPTPHSAMHRHLTETPPPAHTVDATIPPTVSKVLAKALSKQPEERYENVLAFANALRDGITEPIAEDTLILDTPEASGLGVTQPSRPLGAPLTDTQQASDLPLMFQPKQAPNVNHGQQNQVAPQPPPQTLPTRLPRQTSGFPQRNIIAGIIGAAVLGSLLCAGLLALYSALNNREDDTEIVANLTDFPPTAVDATLLAEVSVTEEQNATSTNLPPVEGEQDIPPTADLSTGVGAENEEVASVPTLQPMDLQPGQLSPGQILFNQPETPARDAVFSPDGQMVASAHGNGAVRLWRDLNSEPLLLTGHNGIVTAVAFSPDGSMLASTGEDGTIRLWDTETGTVSQVLSGHTAAARDVDFNSNGTQLVSVGEDNTVRLWDALNGTLLQTMTSDSRWLSVSFSPDDSRIASGGANAQIAIWESATGVRVNSLAGHNEEVRSVAFSPDGTILASSSTDNTIRLWQIDTEQTIRTMLHGQDVWVVKFSPDGRFLASGGRDNNLRVWDVETGAELANLTGHTGWVIGADFSPTGDRLVSAGGDGTVRLWESQ
jgi:eukaryotic-like serine/threonine-protein kinase